MNFQYSETLRGENVDSFVIKTMLFSLETFFRDLEKNIL